jgi:sec-independent protein translocase protein TatA
MNLGVTELLIILGVVLLLFGSTRLPKLARSVGLASKEFKKGVSESDDDEDTVERAKTEPQALETPEARQTGDTKRPASPSSS